MKKECAVEEILGDKTAGFRSKIASETPPLIQYTGQPGLNSHRTNSRVFCLFCFFGFSKVAFRELVGSMQGQANFIVL